MAFTLGDAIVHFRGDRRPLQQAQAQAHRETKAWTYAVGSLISTGVTAAANMAGKAIIGIGKAGLEAAIEAMPIQDLRIAFRGISDDADAMLSRLRKGSLGMVRDAELMRTYNEAAQLVGKSFADQLPDAMQYLSKVSAATGQDMGFLLDSLTKGVGRLSPMILDNLAIQVSLSEATERASQMFGVQADEVTKAMTQEAMMALVLEKLAKNTENIADVSDSAATKWQRFKTILANLKDMLGEAVIPIILALIEPVGELAEKHGPKLVEWAQTASEWLAKKIPEAVKLARRALRYLSRRGLRGVAQDILGFIREKLQDVDWKEVGLSILRAIAGAAIRGYEILRGFVTSLWEGIKQRIAEVDWSAVWQTLLGKLGGLWEGVKQHILEADWSAIGQALLTKIAGVFSSIKGGISAKVGEILGGIFGGGGEEGEGGGGEGGGTIGGLLDKITGFISGPGGTIISVLGTIIGLITGIGAPIALIIGAVKLLSMAWETNFGGIRDFAAEALGKVNEVIDRVRAAIRRLAMRAKALFARFKTGVDEGLGPLLEKGKAIWTWIQEVAIPILRRWGRSFARGLMPHLKNIWGLFERFVDDIQPRLQEVWEELRKAWDEIATVVMEELWPAIKELLEELGINVDSVDSFSESFGDFIGMLIELGVVVLLEAIKVAITGLVTAIRLGKRQVLSWVRGFRQLVDLITGAIQGIKDLAENISNLTGIELPEWLQSHSLPPLAQAIREITAAIGDMPRDIGSRLGGIAAGASQTLNDQRRYTTLYGTRIYAERGSGALDELLEASLVR